MKMVCLGISSRAGDVMGKTNHQHEFHNFEEGITHQIEDEKRLAEVGEVVDIEIKITRR